MGFLSEKGSEMCLEPSKTGSRITVQTSEYSTTTVCFLRLLVEHLWRSTQVWTFLNQAIQPLSSLKDILYSFMLLNFKHKQTHKQQVAPI
jgi:hypothetical protein